MLLKISIEGGADKGENVAQEKTFRRNMRFFGIRWRLSLNFDCKGMDKIESKKELMLE